MSPSDSTSSRRTTEHEQNRIEIGDRYRGVGDLGGRGFGVERDTESGGLEHVDVVRPIADGNDLVGRDALRRCDVFEQRGLPLPVDDRSVELAGQHTASSREPIGEGVVEVEFLFQAVGEEREAATDDRDLEPEALQGPDERAGPRREVETFPCSFEDFDGLAGKERNPSPQRFLEVEVALHRGFGDRGNLAAAANDIGDKIDHLVLYERRVDVEHDEALGPASHAFALDSNIEGGRRGSRGQQHVSKLIAVAARHSEFVAVDRVPRQSFDPIDVVAALGDHRRYRVQVRRRHLLAEDSDDPAERSYDRRRVDDLKIDVEAMLPTEEQRILQQVVARRHVDHDAERDVAADDDLFHVVDDGVCVSDVAHQQRNDPALIGSGDVK